MDHIQELRKLIGHRPILMVGSGVLIEDADQRLLLLKRSDNQCWGLPGGAVEPGEEIEQAARREILEETGLEVHDLELFGVFSGPEFFYEYPNGDQVYNVTIVYKAGGVSGDIRLNHEHSAWQYSSYEDLPPNDGTPIVPVLRECIERRKATHLIENR
jgi:ADP-ribose pyrophosphatase YjhB (NUDIX family)